MTTNILELDQVCNIADSVYWEVIEHLGLYDVMVEEDPNHAGSSIRCTQNTEKGEELYYLIENAVMNAIDYQDNSYTCPKFEPTEE
jgi:hypothetical protein